MAYVDTLPAAVRFAAIREQRDAQRAAQDDHGAPYHPVASGAWSGPEWTVAIRSQARSVRQTAAWSGSELSSVMRNCASDSCGPIHAMDNCPHPRTRWAAVRHPSQVITAPPPGAVTVST